MKSNPKNKSHDASKSTSIKSPSDLPQTIWIVSGGTYGYTMIGMDRFRVTATCAHYRRAEGTERYISINQGDRKKRPHNEVTEWHATETAAIEHVMGLIRGTIEGLKQDMTTQEKMMKDWERLHRTARNRKG